MEEREQFSLTQVVSQVGGDLGLYVGVSMFSLLQLVTIFYNMNQKHNEEVARGTESRKHVVSRWFAFVSKYVARSLHSDTHDFDGHLDAINSRFESLESRMRRYDEMTERRTRPVGTETDPAHRRRPKWSQIVKTSS